MLLVQGQDFRHNCEHGQPPRHPKGALRWTNISVDTIQALVRVELFEGSRRLFVSDAGMAAVVNDFRARTRCGPPTSFDLRSTVVRTGPARVPLNLDSTCSAASASKRLPDVGSKKRVRLHVPEAITKYVFTVSTLLQVTLVRHGQSTWNKEGRIQGSSDLSVLTQKGESQAEITREMLQVSPNSSQQRSPDVDTLYFFRESISTSASVVPLLVQVELPKSYGIHGIQSSSICGSYGRLIYIPSRGS